MTPPIPPGTPPQDPGPPPRTPFAPVDALPRVDAAAQPSPPPLQYLVYDRGTGTVLYRYSLHRIAGADGKEPSDDQVVAGARGAGALPGGSVSSIPDVGVVRLEDGTALLRDVRVDPDTGRLVPRPRLRLTADRRELQGDGEDSTTITVTVTDGDGRVLRDRHDTVKVATSRGRLSNRGGIVDLREGTGAVTLRSVAETVSSVSVSARTLTGDCTPHSISLEFL